MIWRNFLNIDYNHLCKPNQNLFAFFKVLAFAKPKIAKYIV